MSGVGKIEIEALSSGYVVMVDSRMDDSLLYGTFTGPTRIAFSTFDEMLAHVLRLLGVDPGAAGAGVVEHGEGA